MKTFQIGNFRNRTGSLCCQVYLAASSVEEAAKVARELSKRYFKPLQSPVEVDKVPDGGSVVVRQ